MHLLEQLKIWSYSLLLRKIFHYSEPDTQIRTTAFYRINSETKTTFYTKSHLADPSSVLLITYPPFTCFRGCRMTPKAQTIPDICLSPNEPKTNWALTYLCGDCPERHILLSLFRQAPLSYRALTTPHLHFPDWPAVTETSSILLLTSARERREFSI